MNLPVVLSCSNTRWLASAKLHVKNYEQMFLSFVSVMIHDRLDRRGPCYCVVNGLAYNFLYSKHFLIIFF